MVKKRARFLNKLAPFFFFLLFQTSYADPGMPRKPENIFYKGNQYYEDSRYDEAISQYLLLIEQGFESGPLYYNLGNCYFKKGNLGEAILHYERAMRIMPSDRDLKFNYETAKSFVKGDLIESPEPWYMRVSLLFFKEVSMDILISYLAIIYSFFFLILILRIFFQSISRLFFTALLVLTLTFMVGSLSLYEKIVSIGREAITTAEKAKVRLEPFESAAAHFTLYEGMKVRVLSFKGNWCKVAFSNKKTGWVETLSIELI